MPTDVLSFEWDRLIQNLIRITAAFVLTVPIAWEREGATRMMGLRTFPLVVVASCSYVLVAIAVIGASSEGARARQRKGWPPRATAERV